MSTAVAGALVIGAGLIGRRRASALEELGIPVVAVVDPNVGRAEEVAGSLRSKPRVYADLANATIDGDADFAIVASSHDALAPSTLVALDMGCHALVEKPGALDATELVAVAAAATRNGRTVRVGYNHRFHPAVLGARSIVASERFGPLLSIRARYGHGGRLGYESEWRADPARGGGELLDQGSHLVDLVRFLGGDATLEFAELRTDFWDAPVEDNAYLALRIDAGGFAWLHASWTEWKNLFAVEIGLREARLDIIGLGGSYGTERLVVHAMRPELGPPETSEQLFEGPDQSWRSEVEDVLGGVAGREAVGAGIEDGLAVLRILDEARRR